MDLAVLDVYISTIKLNKIKVSCRQRRGIFIFTSTTFARQNCDALPCSGSQNIYKYGINFRLVIVNYIFRLQTGITSFL